MKQDIATRQLLPFTPGQRTRSKFVLWFENLVKVPVFGCQRCGECILSSTGFICSQKCPKRLRNGPCGGTGEDGSCEVHPDRMCVWYRIHKRSKILGRTHLLLKFNKIHNWDLEGTSAWLNVWNGRIDKPIWAHRQQRPERKEESA